VRRLINELEDFQDRAGFRFFWITRGGNPTGEKDSNGNDLYSATEYIDVGKPIADEAVSRARASDEWKGNAAKGIKAHPGLALVAQVSWAVSQLPKINVQTDTATKAETKPLTPAEYRDMRRPRIVAAIESYADGIEERGGDDEMELEWLEVEVKRIRESRVRTRSARHDRSPLLAVDAVENATANTSYKTDLSAELHTAVGMGAHLEVPRGGGVTKMSPLLEVTTIENSGLENTADTTMLEWALLWASRGIPVFPLHEAIDGICTCSCSDHWRKVEGRWVQICEGGKHVCGSECASPGKHPRSDRRLGMSKGVKMATVDPEKIKLWWGKYPTANIGGRMLGKVGFDVDPKNGGNASLHDICEKYGQEWLDTWENVSGSGGPHFIFDNPSGVSFKNSAGKLGLGLDTRGDDGYLVMPPSGHVSGGTYAVVSPNDFRPFPQFLIDLLNKPKSENEIEYQDAPKGSGGVGWGEKFLDGHRNDGLLAYGLGRMRHAWERTEEEHYQQLSGVNQARCVPPLDDDEVRSLAAHVAYDYASFYGVNAKKQEAA
jgi:hypothetical protein